MASLLDLFKKKDPVPPVVDARALATAKRAGEEEWHAPEPSNEIKLACLKRVRYLASKNRPELAELSGEAMKQLEPSGLSDQELWSWYFGVRGEAAHRYLVICNQSWSKREVSVRIAEEGLEDIATILDEKTKRATDYILKFRSD